MLVENFKTDVKHRLKIDYESLSKLNPRLIVGSISGFGQEGPYASRPGFDQIIQGMSGLMSLTGSPDGEPMRAGIAVSDTSAGMFLGQGILLALLERQQTGRGQWVHTACSRRCSASSIFRVQDTQWTEIVRVGKAIIIQQLRLWACLEHLMDLSIWQRPREECGGHFVKVIARCALRGSPV